MTHHPHPYRIKGNKRHKHMTLPAAEFIRRFLIHVLPSGFHRIRHYGLLANKARAETLSLAQQHLLVTPEPDEPAQDNSSDTVFTCRDCGEPMIVVSRVERHYGARAPPLRGGAQP